MKKKLTKEEKINKKYGNEFMESCIGTDKCLKEYYKMYVDCTRKSYLYRDAAWVAYFISLALIVASLWHSALAIPGLAFLILGVQGSLYGSIENLWATRFSDRFFEYLS